MKLWISYIEVYNEQINDLLNERNVNLKVQEDRNKMVQIENLSKFEIENLDQVEEYLAYGNRIKRIADNNQNDKSSRSHSVFRI